MTKEVFDISKEIHERKYQYNGETVQGTFERQAKHLSSVEEDQDKWYKQFLWALEDFKFLNGGRIITNAGTNRKNATMFNCYVMNKIPDSMDGIFDVVKEAALTQQMGGGVGFDFSTLRPSGAYVAGCESESSGPISFMNVLDATCRTIQSAGNRRGAQMGVLNVSHPDIYKFIESKRGNNALQMFNISVGVTDAFMDAVNGDLDWELTFEGKIYETVKAIDLWDKIIRATYDYAEPGVLFLDNINKMNNLWYCEDLKATNPCGEQPLPPYGACLLGAVNLTKFVKDPFGKDPQIDYGNLAKIIRIGVRMLDNVIELSEFPLEQQKQEAYDKRRMGLGITGLANMLLMLKQVYGGEESLTTVDKLMKFFTETAYGESIKIAEEKGAFPKLDREKYVQSKFVKRLDPWLSKQILEHGIRNSHLTTIAPTGTTSMFAGNVSSGLEPTFARVQERKIRNKEEGDESVFELVDYGFLKYRDTIGVDGDLPDYFVTTADVTPMQHINVQAAIQKWIDSSTSKTINVPTEYPFEDFKDIYTQAYEKGLKGCTTFRPSAHIQGVIKVKDESDDEPEPKKKEITTKRPDKLTGTTYKLKSPHHGSLYVTINDKADDEGINRPYEMFIQTKKLGVVAWTSAMTRLISAVFRHDKDPSYIVEELKTIFDPTGGYYAEGKYMKSLIAHIGYTIEQHLKSICFLEDDVLVEKPKDAKIEMVENDGMEFCPECQEKTLLNNGGCLTCQACGYSKCG
jgi:ribonucleoside-diphosphate reductase alpha chain